MKAETCPDAPLDERLRADVLVCPVGEVDQCPGHQDIVDLYVKGQDTDSLSSKELSRWVAKLNSEMKGKDQMMNELGNGR